MAGTVGIVGLGIMGGAFARNLVAAGWTVVGYDVDKATSKAAQKAGVQLAGSLEDLATRASDIITSLPSAKAVFQTIRAIASVEGRKHTVVETSTLSLPDKLELARLLDERGHVMLDCPVSGTGAQAAVKDIVVFASGEARHVERLEPLFAGFSRQSFDLGAVGNGTRMKLVANHLVAIHNVATAEAMVLGMKAGLDPHQIVEVVRTGAGNSRVLELRGPMMADGVYEPATMRSRTWKKDIAVIGELAASLDCPTPLFDTTRALYDSMLALGLGEQDTGAVCTVIETMAGLKRKPKKPGRAR